MNVYRHYPGRIGYLCLVTLGFAFLFELVVSAWAGVSQYFSGRPIDVKECINVLPRYCLQMPGHSSLPLPLFVLAIIKAFFFATLVSLFYEVYKSLVEWRRGKYIESAIYRKFRWRFNRRIGTDYRYIPWYWSFSYLKVNIGLTDEEIIRACTYSRRLRVANMALTRSLSSYQNEKDVVELYFKNRPYGAFVNNKSNVTIIVAETALGLSKFGFYLAYFGGFNFISKEIKTDESFYNVTTDTKKIRSFGQFKKDIDILVNVHPDKGLIILLTAYKYKKDRKIYLLNSMNDGETNDSDRKSTCSNDELIKLKEELEKNLSRLKKPVSLKLTEDDTSEDYYLRNTKVEHNLLYEIGCDDKKNGIVLGIPSNINVWDDKRLQTIQAIAKAIGESAEVKKTLSERRLGYDFPEYINQSTKYQRIK